LTEITLSVWFTTAVNVLNDDDDDYNDDD